MTRRRWLLVSAALLSATQVSVQAAGQGVAQGATQGSATQPPQRGGRRGSPAERDQREQNVREALIQRFREVAQLTDSQVVKFSAVMRSLARPGSELIDSERCARFMLRGQLTLGPKANQDTVEAMLSQLMALQQDRLNLMQREQFMLAAFLTPVQRARYMALQEGLVMQFDQVLQGGAGDRRGGPPPRDAFGRDAVGRGGGGTGGGARGGPPPGGRCGPPPGVVRATVPPPATKPPPHTQK